MSANYESQPDQQQYENAIQENSYIDRANADPIKSQQQSSERIDNEYPQHQDKFHHDSFPRLKLKIIVRLVHP